MKEERQLQRFESITNRLMKSGIPAKKVAMGSSKLGGVELQFLQITSECLRLKECNMFF